jgi:hypothetical protein
MVTLSTKPTPPVAGAHLPEGRMARTVALELNPHHVEQV